MISTLNELEKVHVLRARTHRQADKACNRSWECACGYCNTVRRDEKLLASLNGFHSVKAYRLWKQPK